MASIHVASPSAMPPISLRAVAAAVVLAVLPGALGACALREGGAPALMLEGDVVEPPTGWEVFCARTPDHCAPPVQPASELPTGADAFARLEQVNRAINAAIAPSPDIDQFGVPDRWTLPLTVDDTRIGDCEDYALEKRNALIALGWPPDALRLAVATSRETGAHAALIAITAEGDYVLDNLVDDVRPWSLTDYVWLKRQASDDPRQWRRVRYQ